ncbi:LysR family transcriptional regulator [Variovorax guangxiensis]|uniref:DNA-binding transcriptional LysR family regulator n=1 Tax=Variovorax guangxiensis TaxID=1775474 RepID=A0A840FY61_9BURK|nr:LysR family transcriptional regulator [Variovorax guangxiensis]MBB4221628.1 DNA-binding transcriptional LysR family regulator [Variovorax guangxiensis]
MDSLELLRTFNEVAVSGSFSRAARHLELSRATVSKYVAKLEGRFGVRLLNRNSHAVSLTDAGVLLLERSKPMLELVEATRAELQDRALTPSGRLRISAPHGIDQTELPALFNTFLGYYPDASISLLLTNRLVDLAEEGVDIALRFGPIANENLIVRKLLLMGLTVCAAPMYWKSRGVPSHPSELANHDALISTHLNPSSKWRFQVDGEPLEIAVRGRLDATEASPLIQAALQGAGVLYLPTVMLKPYLDSGRLVPALSDFVRSDMWLSAVYLQRRHSTAVHRAFLDFLESRIKAGKTLR